MNKFLTFTGNQPVYLGDIDFMQNAASAAFKQLLRGILNSPSDDGMNAIIQGVEIAYDGNGTWSWTDGVVVLGGELLPIAAGSISAGTTGELYLHVYSTLSGPRTFKNGQSHDCYDTRTAIINTTSEDGVAVSTIARLQRSADEVYDNNYYIIVSGTSRILDSSPRLIRKSGLWFLDIAFSVESEEDPDILVGEIQFMDLRPDHLSQISSTTFSIPVVLCSGSDPQVCGQQLLSCTVTKDDYDMMGVTFSFFLAGSQTASGQGRLQALLPIF